MEGCFPAGDRRWRLPLSVGVLAVSAMLLFYGLGHYPLWEDEADTALYARSIARTGDLEAMLDHNLIAFRYGAALIGLRERYQPPLMFYLAAPFVGREGGGTFWPRFPFAASGLLMIALLQYWLWRDGADLQLWVVFSLGLVCSVSLMLYSRQCRYYPLAMLETVAAAYCYLHWRTIRWPALWLSLLSVSFLLTSYFAFVGFWGAVAMDYALFERRRLRPNWRELMVIVIPQLLMLGYILSTRSPLGREVALHPPNRDVLADKLTLLWWSFRDLNASEIGVGLLMLAAPALYYFVEKDPWLLRAFMAMVAYTVGVTIFSPQPVGATVVADVRYLSAMIPLCIFLTALSIIVLSRRHWAIALPLALTAFGTNVLNSPTEPSQWRSTPLKWVNELHMARVTPIQVVIDWINENVPPGQSIWVMPQHMTYPLMYHAPQAVYAWQLNPPPAGQFKDLPPIHFIGAAPPDYIVTYGALADVGRAIQALKQQRIEYTPTRAFDVYANHLTRPELFWHSFDPVRDFGSSEKVFVFRRNR